MFRSLVRSLSPRHQAGPDPARQERTLAILVGARAVLERGWVQGAWYVLEAQDGRRRFVGAGSLTRRSFGTVVASCLVGAVAESARWYSPERGTAGPALEALWQELGELETPVPVADPWMPTPVLRNRQVCDLTRWNDQRGRSRDDVLRLVDAAIARLTAQTGGEGLEPVAPSLTAAR